MSLFFCNYGQTSIHNDIGTVNNSMMQAILYTNHGTLEVAKIRKIHYSRIKGLAF